ncbi:hypothetical protein Bbelb_436860 [Branchiostoma belcheri]|nr:hypothetical protein Bbelb_436860 [Branchiostoma belcheri]
MPPVSSKFSRKRSVGVKFADQTANVELADVLKLLENHGIPNSDIEGIQKKGKGRCEITFKTQTAFHRFCPSIAMDESVEVNTYGAGVTVVTAVGIPLELDDNFVRHRLKSYGEILNGRYATYASQGFPELKTGTRQYRMILKSHIPNSIRLGEEMLTFSYLGQPKLCHKCGGEGHFVASCVVQKCSKCFELGHLARDCTRSIKCNVVGRKDIRGVAASSTLPESLKPRIESVSSESESEEEELESKHGDGSQEEENNVKGREDEENGEEGEVSGEEDERGWGGDGNTSRPQPLSVVPRPVQRPSIHSQQCGFDKWDLGSLPEDGANKLLSQELTEPEGLDLNLDETIPTNPLSVASKRHLRDSSDSEAGEWETQKKRKNKSKDKLAKKKPGVGSQIEQFSSGDSPDRKEEDKAPSPKPRRRRANRNEWGRRGMPSGVPRLLYRRQKGVVSSVEGKGSLVPRHKFCQRCGGLDRVSESSSSPGANTQDVFELRKRGRGLWKCNVKILSDPVFKQEFLEKYPTWVKEDGQTLREWWEVVKQNSKDLIIKFSKQRAREAALVQRGLERELDVLRSRINVGDRTPKTSEEYESVRERLRQLIRDRLSGQKLRAKVKAFEEDEKPTRFFFKAERSKGQKRIIQNIRDENGDVVSTTPQILATFHKFYSDLFKAGPIDQSEQDFFLSKLSASLPEDCTESLDRQLNLSELETAVKGMENGKSPGSDGLPKEFYVQFWEVLGPDLLAVLNEGLGDGLLSESQREGIISLLDKKGDPLNPANKRPISLLNVDYKIFSKALANRLKDVIGTVVHTDQSCGIPGRSIDDSVCLLRDIVEYVNGTESSCVLIALDQEKAFDRVSHDFMAKVLNKLGFGPAFRNMIAALYSNVKSKVQVNGLLTESIAVERGVRQGCPLSPLLYVLCIEPLAAAIRSDPLIRGVKVPGANQEIKMVQYADDNTCVLSDQPSIDRTFETIGRYEAGTGSKLNMGKTEALWLGSWRGRRDEPYPIKRWTSDSLTILGSPIGGVRLAVDAWMQRFAKFKAKLQAWKDRQLTLFGKVLVVNSIATATLWYIAPVYPLPPSVKVKIEKEIHHFLWDGKTEVVARRTLLLPKEKGGLGLVSVPLKAKALLLKDQAFAESLADKGIDWKSTSVSALYNILLEAEDIVPLCVRADSRVDWLAVWKAIHNPLLNKWERMTSWHAAHNSLKTRLKLYSWRRFVSDRSCPRRGCTQDESVLHLFWECAGISDVWLWLTSLVARKISPGFFPTASFALYGLVPVWDRMLLAHGTWFPQDKAKLKSWRNFVADDTCPRDNCVMSEDVTHLSGSAVYPPSCGIGPCLEGHGKSLRLLQPLRDLYMALEVRCHLRAQANLGPGLIHRMEIRLTERLHFEFERLGPGRFYEVWAEGTRGVDVDATHCTRNTPHGEGGWADSEGMVGSCQQNSKDLIKSSLNRGQEAALVQRGLERELDVLRSRINVGDRTPKTSEEYESVRLSGQKLRAKVKAFEEDEKPTRFFFKAERSKGQKRIIQNIRMKMGTWWSTTPQILATFHKFYSDLFKADCTESLDRQLNLSELETAVKGMENGKSPALANRLKDVIGTVVHTDQSCGIPGRSIDDSVCLLRDIVEYVNGTESSCVLIALDQEKAFDRVSHDFMAKPSIDRTFETIGRYEAGTGSKLNMGKTEAFVVGELAGKKGRAVSHQEVDL